MLENALLAALIAVVCVLAVTFLGGQASASFSKIGSSIGRSNTN
jgi:Flp pilus assembly pilin Flp